jgi:hypothetical protein
MAHLDSGPGQQLARGFYKHAITLHIYSIADAINLVPGHLGISGNEFIHNQPHKKSEAEGY